jgi:hypothetical protein
MQINTGNIVIWSHYSSVVSGMDMKQSVIIHIITIIVIIHVLSLF